MTAFLDFIGMIALIVGVALWFAMLRSGWACRRSAQADEADQE